MHTRFTMRQAVSSWVAVGALAFTGCGTSVSTCQLSGDNEVPAVSTSAKGTANATLDGSELTVTGTFSGLQSDLYPVSGSPAHVHLGASGESGDVLFGLNVTSSGQRSGEFTGTKKLNSNEEKAFEQGRLYVNIHSDSNRGGEIRCQFSSIQ